MAKAPLPFHIPALALHTPPLTHPPASQVELSLELAGTALNVATGHYYDLYGDQYASTVGFTHTGFLKQGGNLVMKIYDVSRSGGRGVLAEHGLQSLEVRQGGCAGQRAVPHRVGPRACCAVLSAHRLHLG